MGDLIDTTEAYLKTIYELEEDGITPLRARIVGRLGHSGPTVSQTVARLERIGLLNLRADRHLDLTDEGKSRAAQVMRRHRLAECMLVNILGISWEQAHTDACRWEHAISHDVEERMRDVLKNPTADPYGNPIPGSGERKEEVPVELAIGKNGAIDAVISRIGEPIQANLVLMRAFAQSGLKPGAHVHLEGIENAISITFNCNDASPIIMPSCLTSRLFILRPPAGGR